MQGQVWRIAWQIFVRDFKVRYRRAFFGVLWAWIAVLGLGASVALVAGELGGPEQDHFPRVLMIVVSLAVWQAFAGALSAPQQMARRCRSLLCTIPMRPEILPAASVISVAVSYLMQLPIVIGLLMWYGVGPSLGSVAGIVVGFGIMLIAGLAMGAFLLPLSLIFTDVRYSMSLLQGALLLATPVLYPLRETGLVAQVNRVNPLTPLVTGVRHWVLFGSPEISLQFVVIFCVFAVALAVAMLYNRRFLGMAIVHI